MHKLHRFVYRIHGDEYALFEVKEREGAFARITAHYDIIVALRQAHDLQAQIILLRSECRHIGVGLRFAVQSGRSNARLAHGILH